MAPATWWSRSDSENACLRSRASPNASCAFPTAGMTTLTSMARHRRLDALSRSWLSRRRRGNPRALGALGDMRGHTWPGPLPPLQDFGSRSGMSHLLHAPNASPNETASSTAHRFRMRMSPDLPERGRPARSSSPARRPMGRARGMRAVETIKELHKDFESPDAGTPTQRHSRSGPVAAEPRLAPRGQDNAGGFHGAAILDAYQAVADRVLPNRHARAGAAPCLHGLAIGALAVGDEGKELQRQGIGRRGCLGRHGIEHPWRLRIPTGA